MQNASTRGRADLIFWQTHYSHPRVNLRVHRLNPPRNMYTSQCVPVQVWPLHKILKLKVSQTALISQCSTGYVSFAFILVYSKLKTVFTVPLKRYFVLIYELLTEQTFPVKLFLVIAQVFVFACL